MRVAVIVASGYTGLELLRILLRHPDVQLAAITSERSAGRPVAEVHPAFRGLLDLRFEALDPASLALRVDAAFAALPHAASAPVVRELVKAGVRVVDLSADFRLRDPATYAAWYGEHAAPELLGQSVYGIPEFHREALRATRLVATPGCYPTSALLPLAPFLRERCIDPAAVLVDSKSGVSGAGRKADESLSLAEMAGNCRAYNVGGAHRHVPEMEEQASELAGTEVRLSFVPQLLPAVRGIATTVFARPTPATTTEGACALLEAAYLDEPFVRVLPPGETPSLAAVRGSNFCDVAAVVDSRTGMLVLLSALDNLVKGAGGQAVQCFNVMAGFPETRGLLEAPFVP
jgi:N-acetyl-gamma-glutamyl-phosphate reductase